jgi:hypothetical protein
VANPVRRARCSSSPRGSRWQQPSDDHPPQKADRCRRPQDGTLARRFFASDCGAGLWASLIPGGSERLGRHHDDESAERTFLRDCPKRSLRLRVVPTPTWRSIAARVNRHEDLVAGRARRRFRHSPQAPRLVISARPSHPAPTRLETQGAFRNTGPGESGCYPIVSVLPFLKCAMREPWVGASPS